MKFLQIGDLHLGKKLHEFSLYEDQVFMLEKILEILKADNYDGLFICGDIYDQSNPAQSSIQLFGNFLEKLKDAFPELAVFIISGNHDSAIRIAFASEIFKTQNIFIQTSFDENTEPLIFKSNNETCAIFMLPFLQHSILKREKSSGIMEQVEVMKEATTILKEKIRSDMPNILLAHLLTLPDDKTSDNENKDIKYWGTAQLIPKELFDFFDYVALGHIHRMTKITEKMYYAGSPFAYSFDEAKNTNYQKFALSVEINCSKKNPIANVNTIPIPQLHRLYTLSGTFSEFISTDKFDKYAGDYLRIDLLDSEAVESAMQLLQAKFPLLMHIRQKSFEGLFVDINSNADIKNLGEKNFDFIYRLFINDIESETDEEELALAQRIWDEYEKEKE